ncbi:FadR/GntR family transcriptional regulator [uncultured Ilyobacter sp.]|uniref:FadR/GntR family transcriptional regulator n=1 Tax=uncultured Ilyobacter sp. TaxID=544433 RepID=UPI0029F5C179|nr:FadR/GntR family transcriptional regulator [uncultured Ilyobacter sp.]
MTKKYDIVVEYIKNGIKKGSIKYGDKLLPERVLAEKLHIGRSTVREGIKVLEIMGLVESRRGGGNYITNNFENMLYNPITLMFSLQNGSYSDVHELRKMLEESTIELCVERITDEEIKVMEEVHQRLLESTDEAQMSLVDLEFHSIIAKASKNPLIISILNSVSEILENSVKTSRRRVIEKFGKKTIDKDHQAIVDALKERNLKKAKKAIREHFDHIEKTII